MERFGSPGGPRWKSSWPKPDASLHSSAGGTAREHEQENPAVLPKRTVLESGASVVSESMSGVESVSFGLYFPTGSRPETELDNGVSHVIEHLVF